MSSSVPTTHLTQVFPQQSGTAVSAPFTAQNGVPLLGTFLKGEPKALGIVQIMIGVINILFGIIMAINVNSIAVGILYWGGITYIISGALTVAADKNLNRCLVNGSLGMNICSSVTAGFAIMILSVDLGIVLVYSFCQSYECLQIADIYETRSHGITGVLLVFSILEFIISIYVSSFACRAVCCSTAEHAVFVQIQQAPINTVTQGYLPSPAVNTHDVIYASSEGPSVLNNSTVVDIN